MADGRLIFEIVAEGKNIKLVQKQTDDLAESVEDTHKAREKSSKSQGKYNKLEKGIHQTNLSSAKGFSKMNQTMGGSSGLVGAYATLAANIFAATAAFNALKRAAQLNQLIDGLKVLGTASGVAMEALAVGIRDATGAAISLDQALRTASVGASAGFDQTQLIGLAKAARGAAVSLGRDVGDAVDRLTRGAAKLEPEILDELGIFVRLDDASSEYAASIGKSTDELTRFEQRMAFTNKIIEQGEEKFGAVADAVKPDVFTQLGATLQDLAQTVLGTLASILGPFVSFLANSKLALAALIAAVTKGIMGAMLPQLTMFTKKAKEAAAGTLAAIGINVRASKASVSALQAQIGPLDFIKGKTNEKILLIKKEGATQEQMLDLMKDLTRIEKIRATAAKKMSGERLERSKRETAAIEREKRKLQELINEEKKRASGVGGQKFAEAEHGLAGRSEGIMSELDADLDEAGGRVEGKMKAQMASYKRAMSEANRSGKDFRKDVRKSGKRIGGFAGKIPGLSKALIGGGAAFKRFGLMGKIAIKGLVSAIPFIGQMLFVLDIAISLLKKAFSWMKGMGGEASEASKKQELYNKQVENYANVQEAANDKSQTASQFIISQGNATKGLLDAMDASRKAINKQNEEANLFGKIWIATLNLVKREWAWVGTLFNNFGNRIEWLTNWFKLGMAKMRKYFADWVNPILKFYNKWIAGDDKSLQVKLIEQDEADKQIQIARDAITKINEERLLATTGETIHLIPPAAMLEFKTLQTAIQGGGRTQKELAAFLGTDNINEWVATVSKAAKGEGVGGLSDGVQTLIKDMRLLGDGVIDTTELQELLAAVMRKASEETVLESKALQGFASTIKDGNEKISAFVTGLSKKSKYTETLSTFVKLDSALKDLSDSADLVEVQAIAEQFEAAGPGINRLLGGIESLATVTEEATVEFESFALLGGDIKKDDYIREAIQRRIVELIRSGSSEMAKQLRIAVDHELSAKRRLGVNKELIKRIKLGGKLNTKALREEIKLNNENLGIQQTSIEHQMQNLRAVLGLEEGQLVTKEEYAAMTVAERQEYQSLLNLRQQHADLGYKVVDAAEAELKVAKIQLDLDYKKTKTALLRRKTAQAQLKLDQEMANIAKGYAGELSPAQEFLAKIKTAEIAVATAEAELAMTDSRFKLEVAIFKLKHSDDEGKLKKGAADVIAQMETVHAITRADTAEKVKQSKIALQSAKVSGIGGMGITGESEGFGAFEGRLKKQNDAIQMGAAALSKYMDVKYEDQYKANKNREDALEAYKKEKVSRTATVASIAAAKAHLTSMENIQAETEAADKAASRLLSRENITILHSMISPMLEDLKKMGPQGEAVAQATEGILSLTAAFDDFRNAATPLDRIAAVGGMIAAVASIAAAASKSRVAGIDKEIEAEKKRDGKSKESLAKIKAMEQKKEKQKKKAFETNKKMMIAQTIINTITAAMGAFAALAPIYIVGPALGAIAAGMITALGAAQIAIIAGTSYQGGGSLGGSSIGSVSVGNRGNKVDVAGSKNQAGELSYLRGERGVGTGSGDYRPGGFMGRKYRAAGGPIVVGEQGPELFAPKVPGEIIANQAAAVAPLNVNFQVSAIDASNMQDMLTTQRGSIIDMIREAANSHGENFLETVDTSGYGSEDTSSSYEPASGIGGSM